MVNAWKHTCIGTHTIGVFNYHLVECIRFGKTNFWISRVPSVQEKQEKIGKIAHGWNYKCVFLLLLSLETFVSTALKHQQVLS